MDILLKLINKVNADSNTQKNCTKFKILAKICT